MKETPRTALVVEDNPSDVLVLRVFLSDARAGGMRIVPAGTLQEAIDTASAVAADVVLLDLELPDSSGLETLGRFQERYPDLPIIVLTASDDAQIAVAALRAGASDYLVKGHYDGQALLRSIRLAIESGRAERMRRDLSESEERYRLLFEQNPAGLLRARFDVAALDGEHLEGNAAYVKMLGFASRDDVAGLPLSAVFRRERGWAALAEQLVADGEVTNVEVELRRADGTTSWALVNAVLRRRDGSPEATVEATLLDITERRQLEEQLRLSQRMEAVGRLAGGVAHDFNNMLTVINGYADLLLRRVSLQDPLHADLEEVRRAGQRAATITRQLLAFSRQQVLTPRVLDLDALVADLNKMLGRLLGEDVEITVDAATELWSVRADPGQIEQVIVNLAVNARDAMPSGGRLEFRLRNEALDASRALGITRIPAGEWVTLEIEDTGCGMDAGTQSRIFEPFFTTKEHGKGTGLGLATVYGIVKQSDGFIEVASEPGIGTRFTIYLPRVAEAAVPVESLGEEEHAARGHETVLLVEDEPAVRRLGAASLRTAGFHVLEAADGGEAMLIGEQHEGEIDLLLTDVVMPRMNGPQVVERLRSIRPAMKVLYVSGYADDALRSHGIVDERTAFLPKPFGFDTLVAKVREVIDGNHRTR